MADVLDQDLISATPESNDPDYLAWRDAKVKKALAESRAHPDQRIPQSKVWEKFGVES